MNKHNNTQIDIAEPKKGALIDMNAVPFPLKSGVAANASAIPVEPRSTSGRPASPFRHAQAVVGTPSRVDTAPPRGFADGRKLLTDIGLECGDMLEMVNRPFWRA